MSFARIEFFVGRKYGMWAAGTKTYPSASIAAAEAKAHAATERGCGATALIRRVVPA